MLATILGYYHKKAGESESDVNRGPHTNSPVCTVSCVDPTEDDWHLSICVHEDNQTCITCLVTGKTLL